MPKIKFSSRKFTQETVFGTSESLSKYRVSQLKLQKKFMIEEVYFVSVQICGMKCEIIEIRLTPVEKSVGK